MASSRRIAPEIKEQILKRIKDDGIPVAQAAKEHGIHETTIYNWLSTNVSSGPALREVQALKKENALLLSLVGAMTVQLSRSQKNR
jgi:transposase-like protein